MRCLIMNKKEINEIRKQFTPNNCTITRMCGCYVDGEKNKKTELKEAFLSLPEEEIFKYFDIFRNHICGIKSESEMPDNTVAVGFFSEAFDQTAFIGFDDAETGSDVYRRHGK